MKKITIALLMITSICYGISIDPLPSTLIRATASSGLNHTEGVAFTPSGDYVAAVNSFSNSITFYKQIDGGSYESTPSFTIGGSQSQLNYPHDLSFSPDGNYLAVANKKSHSILIYKRDLMINQFPSVPVAEISGVDSQVVLPGAVLYSPIENSLIVANGLTNTLTFFHYEDDQYDQQPYQVIENPTLAVPDGLSMSIDGNLLAVTSHDSHAVVIFQRIGPSSSEFNQQPLQVINKEEGKLSYPHSVAFHPITNDLAVSNSQGRQNVHLYKSTPNSTYLAAPTFSMEVTEMYDKSTITFLEQLHQEGGVKGIAFSTDGESFAIVQNLCEGLLQRPNHVSVLAIFKVKE